MPLPLIGLLGVAIVIAIGTLTDIDLGLLAFFGAIILGVYVAGYTVADVYAGFPTSLSLQLVATFFMAGAAKEAGLVEWLVNLATRLSAGRAWTLPWAVYLTAVGLMSVNVSALPILTIVGTDIIRSAGIPMFLMGVMIAQGHQAGLFSPVAPYGLIIDGQVRDAGLPSIALPLWLLTALAYLLITIVAFWFFGGRQLLARKGALAGQTCSGPGGSGAVGGALDRDSATPSIRPSFRQALALLSIFGAVVVDAAGGELAVAAFAAALVILAFLPKQRRVSAFKSIQWPAIALISGMLTLVAVVTKMGTISYVVEAAKGLGSPILFSLAINYIAAITSSFASSVGLVTALTPAVLPFVQDGSLGAAGALAAIGVCTTVVDISPFSIVGATILGIASMQDGVDAGSLRRKMLRYTAIVCLVVPPILTLLVVMPGF